MSPVVKNDAKSALLPKPCMLMNDGMQASSLLIVLCGDLFEICADVSTLVSFVTHAVCNNLLLFCSQQHAKVYSTKRQMESR